ncbi:SspB family protein [Pseudomonadota bacterium]
MSDEHDNFDTLRYDIWVEEALRSVINKTLTHVGEHGLPGDHHFYISFLTQADGVDIPARLRAQHPNDMTIVLQHQYEELSVGDEVFSVTLSFGGVKERLTIPYAAVISFADPSVNFALQLKMMSMDDEDDEDIDFEADHLEFFEATRREAETAQGNTDPKSEDDDDHKTGEVITLDAFRKK